jgi:phospholipase C
MRTILRNTLLRNTLILGAIGAATVATAQIGCSQAPDGHGSPVEPGSHAPSEGTGSVGLKLTLPGGAQINSISWTITGPSGASTVIQSGTVNVQNSTGINFVVGGIPAGTGYSIALTGASTNGSVTCVGSATFSITARTTTSVAVPLQCNTAPGQAGTVSVTATTYNCATINSVTANPSETTVGNSIAVSGAATAPNASGITYAWSAPTGSFSAPNSAQTNFTCGTTGNVTLTLTTTDGPLPAGSSCNAALSTTTVQVVCDGHLDAAAQLATATKIKHLVVIFHENISYDHYFGTYPVAQNNPGETPFTGAPSTPTGNGLTTPLDPTKGFAPGVSLYSPAPNLLTANPTAANTANGAGASNPLRLGPSQAATSDQGHNYSPEQEAADHGLMDLYPEFTGTKGPPPGSPAQALTTGLVMGYFDGNTLGTYWGYAQSYALNDNAWTTNFGPSTPGAINLISGQTNGFLATNHTPLAASHAVADGNGGFTLIGDADPLGDTCSSAADQVNFVGQNIGNLLSAKAISWGWFEGGFNLSATNANGTTGCNRTTTGVAGVAETDYIPHHSPFQYYPSTANPTHARPTSTATIGTTDPANHNYDSADFFAALSAGNLPAVVYLKAPAYQDGHPGYSTPIDEQNFTASVVTALQAAQEWSSTAVVVTYDDSDGWYDHQAPSIVNPSSSVADFLNGSGLCNSGAQQSGAAPTTPLLGAPPVDGGTALPAQGRCGYGTRIPLLVISPYAKANYIDHTLVDQTSVLKFVEDNWLGGQRIQPGGSFDTIANSIQNMMSGI